MAEKNSKESVKETPAVVDPTPYPEVALGIPERPFADDEWPASPTTSPLYDTDGDPDAEPIA